MLTNWNAHRFCTTPYRICESKECKLLKRGRADALYHRCSWAVVFARVMQTAWARYTIWRTTDVQFRYSALIVGDNTPCHFDFMPSYFSTRLALQVPFLFSLHVVELQCLSHTKDPRTGAQCHCVAIYLFPGMAHREGTLSPTLPP